MGHFRQPAIATSRNSVYVVWHDNTPGNSDILYRKSTDGGSYFDATVNLSNNVGGSNNPEIAVANNLPV